MLAAGNLISLDLGSSGGRLHLGELTAEGHLSIEQVAGFHNGPVQLGSRWYWDILQVWSSLGEALSALSGRLDGPATLGIDSFGVDYLLTDGGDHIVAGPRHMRDPRTRDRVEAAYAVVPRDELYRRTGSMEIEINSLFQLLADRRDQPWLWDVADNFYLVPDFLGHLLTGRRYSEISIASTTELIDPRRRDWDQGLLERFGVPTRLFPPVLESGTIVGPVIASEARRLGFAAPVDVVAVASHDTASAAAAVPHERASAAAFISLGTWSLVGRERPEPDLSDLSYRLNFTNECGVAGRTVHHKIQAGLWLAQEARRILGRGDPAFDFAAFEAAAASRPPLGFVFDVDAVEFRDPPDMVAAIRDWFVERGLAVPESRAEIARAIYDSLALSYVDTVADIERLTGDRVEVIHVVGGGAAIPTLLQAIADATGRRVLAGPVEATVIGNIIAQLVARRAIPDFEAGRGLVASSFRITTYTPLRHDVWQDAHQLLAGRAISRPLRRAVAN